MLTFIIGKSDSGKSKYAENRLERLIDVPEKYYIATMKVSDDKARERKKRHLKQREGKGFVTIEQFTDIAKVAGRIEDGSAVLLECMTNLIANEMFEGAKSTPEEVAKKILPEITELCNKLNHLLIVSTDPDSYDGEYDDDTRDYIAALAMINGRLKECADEVIEVSGGIPRIIKEKR